MSLLNRFNSIEQIVENALYVHINDKQLSLFAATLDEQRFEHWSKYALLDYSLFTPEQRAMFLLVFNATSFSYWGDPKWTLTHDGITHNRGTFGMIHALQRARVSEKNILDSSYLAEITDCELGKILQGNVEIPLLAERAGILREIGLTLSQKYAGSFTNIIRERENAEDLVNKIVDIFPSFDDTSMYGAEQVSFHKRAQLLVHDLAYSCDLHLSHMENLTACADYILPLVLRHNRVLQYAPKLAFKVDNLEEIPKGSAMEVEIRACTLSAVERIRKKISQQHVTAMQINDYLWLAANTIPEQQPYHHTRTTAY